MPVIIDTGHLVLLPRGPGDKRLIASPLGATVIVCRFWFDPDSLRSMIFALPQVIHIRREEGAEWIDGIFPLLDDRSRGRSARRRTDDFPTHRSRHDPCIAHLGTARAIFWMARRALRCAHRAFLEAIHEAPMQRWSIGALADSAGMSRSSFSERFTALVGRSPLRYQNEFRLRLAREMLAKREARVGEIGLRIGYESEAAFSRAYKEFFGHSPRVEFALQDKVGT